MGRRSIEGLWIVVVGVALGGTAVAAARAPTPASPQPADDAAREFRWAQAWMHAEIERLEALPAHAWSEGSVRSLARLERRIAALSRSALADSPHVLALAERLRALRDALDSEAPRRGDQPGGAGGAIEEAASTRLRPPSFAA